MEYNIATGEFSFQPDARAGCENGKLFLREP
jgi:hypothetical protein